MMFLTCPRCAQNYDISTRIAGDRIWCRCDIWLMLAFHRNGNAYFVVVPTPVSYPRERK
jgi:hypothetical protein